MRNSRRVDSSIVRFTLKEIRMSHCISTFKRHARKLLPVVLLCVHLPLMAQNPGKDGALTVSSPNQVVNLYKTVTANIVAPASIVSVNNTAGLSAGDYVMIYQSRGATINLSDNSSYGTVSALNSAGGYDLREVQSVTANSVTLTAALQNNYVTTGRVQLIRIPQYSTLTITSSGSITGQAYNGLTGGIAAVHVQSALTLDGSINMSGKGFRGGALSSNGGQILQNDVTYRTTSMDIGARKGEGIADSTSMAASGFYGRGAAANGGGGGNRHNAGGGGGANGNNGNTWTGNGVMCTSCTGASAWSLDPAGAGANSSGGGRGGYSYSRDNENATTTGPGNSSWGGDYREAVGGFGGHPVNNNPSGRIFMGGGGGAGHQNNAAGGAGGNGGGVVLVIAATITGSGSIVANGNAGSNTTGTGNDAPGGGGGGGTIIAYAETSLAGITLSANGGNGGSQNISNSAHVNEAEGPGGGGGGGYIATANGAGASQSVSGGANGISNSVALTEFPANGATSGAPGQMNQSITNLPLPVELTSFTAHRDLDNVVLRWRTVTELNNLGFDIERKMNGAWTRIGFVPGHGSSAVPRNYTYEDVLRGTAAHATMLAYRLRQIDRDGSYEYSQEVEIRNGAIPNSLRLDAPYPNPVQDVLVLPLFVPEDQHVSIRIMNMLGEEVLRVHARETFARGMHAISLQLGSLPTGQYMIEARSSQGYSVQPVSVRH
jgi:hypothetical protein